MGLGQEEGVQGERGRDQWRQQHGGEGEGVSLAWAALMPPAVDKETHTPSGQKPASYNDSLSVSTSRNTRPSSSSRRPHSVDGSSLTGSLFLVLSRPRSPRRNYPFALGVGLAVEVGARIPSSPTRARWRDWRA